MGRVDSFTEKGQALVLILLSLAVVLTLVLFVVARSTTDVAISSRSAEANRAFSAAEAGIENALVVGVGSASSIDIGNDASYTSSVTSFAENSTQFNYPIELTSGDSMTTWFVDHESDGSIGTVKSVDTEMTVCWASQGATVDSSSPAVEVSVFYDNGAGETRIGRAVADPYTTRLSQNNFSQAAGGCSINGISYAFRTDLNFSDMGVNTNGLLFARVKMLYASSYHPVGVSVVGDPLPSQGQDIESTGSAGESNRKVQVFQSWPEPPAIFDYVVYGGDNLVK